MMDLPEGYTNNFDEIFRLVEEKGVLALKPDEGSHGDGFYKFTCENGQYQLNYQDVTRQQVLDILEDINNQYLVTEYGCVNVWGLDTRERAEAIISIAHPDFREQLRKEAMECGLIW